MLSITSSVVLILLQQRSRGSVSRYAQRCNNGCSLEFPLAMCRVDLHIHVGIKYVSENIVENP